MRARRDHAADFVMVYAMLIFLAAAFAIADCKDKRGCVERGGRVEEYNRQTIMMPVSCGDGCTSLIPEETSEWRCVESAPAMSR